ncbi:hypothetical protein EB796_015882 [Bugula neritina]|uniref:Uncharacterized protein n=1 Tax=Bugula neritina TaxID=10212 RepID=A0A7J7JHQ6_BUGNE|nr:hypothetical protein EB796_015882 [Bugula neritina]
MQSRPTGRPKDVYKQVHNLYKETSKTLASLRPGGLAVSHKDRSDHNHAVWSLHSNFRKAQTALRKWAEKLSQDAKLAAAGSNADETEAVVKHLEDIFGRRPTRTPIRKIMKDIREKYEEIKKKLHASKPNGKDGKEQQQLFHAAYHMVSILEVIK